ncbi:MAG: hybrid sensor histidine kinase/response regulator [Chloroflexota bacterium]
MNYPPRVLIVDDEPYVRETLGEMLSIQKYELCYASDGLEALQHIEMQSIDLVLLDVMMPDIDGYQVCRQIKSDPRWQHIPIIMVTALDSKSDLKRGFDAGADDFLSKPVNMIELRARTRSMLHIKRQYDELQEVIKLREELANMIVHDMRIPLTAIRGLSELALLDAPAKDQFLEDMQVIHTNAQRLDALLNDVLTLAKMKEGKLVLNQAPVDITALTQSVRNNHLPTAKLKDITLIVEDKATKAMLVQVDEMLFQRVLDNLVSNAIKFSEPGNQVTLQVHSTPQTATASQQMVVKVIDQGIGISVKDRDRIFQKFEVLETQDEQVSQVGLGLAFCKLVVEAHGGRLSVSTNPPRGSIFTVEISEGCLTDDDAQ